MALTGPWPSPGVTRMPDASRGTTRIRLGVDLGTLQNQVIVLEEAGAEVAVVAAASEWDQQADGTAQA